MDFLQSPEGGGAGGGTEEEVPPKGGGLLTIGMNVDNDDSKRWMRIHIGY